MDPFPMIVLLATDGSEGAELASHMAAAIAKRTESELHIVCVVDLGVAADPRLQEGLRQRARELLDDRARKLSSSSSVVADTHMCIGRPDREIITLAETIGAGLIVMGSRSLGGIKRALLGSVSDSVVRHAHCPCWWFARHRPRCKFMSEVSAGKVLLATDGSEDAALAARVAADVATTTGREVHVVHVLEPLPRYAYPEMPEVDAEGRSRDPRLVGDALRRSERDLRERTDKLEGALERRLRAKIALGDPAAAILREAEGEKVLIAVGRRGLGPVRRMRLGSVSTKVLRAAKGPVLVYSLEAI